MKTTIKLLILLIGLFFIHNSSIAQGPPNPPGDPSTGGVGPVGGTAPVGSGTLLLVSMGAIYGIRKSQLIRKRKKDSSV